MRNPQLSPAATLCMLIIIALMTASISACGPAPGGPPPSMHGTPTVSVVTIKSSPLTLTSELVGRVTPVLNAEIRPQVTGIVKQRLFKEGSDVTAGQVLYQIDPATFQAAVDQAEANLSKAKASLSLAKLQDKRNQELVEIKAVSREAAEQSAATLQQAKADVAAAQAELKSQRINLDYTKIKAPASGHIGRSSITVGALVTANQAQALSTIQQLDPVYIDVTQPSIALIELKQSLSAGTVEHGTGLVNIFLQNGSQYAQQGTLKFSEVVVDSATDTVTIRIEVPNPNGELLPGMYALAKIDQGVISDAILIPQQALMRDIQGQSFVAIVGADSVLRKREIVVSKAIKDQWLVESGLSAGDRVVLEGQHKVSDGTEVEVMELSGATPVNIAGDRTVSNQNVSL